MIFHIRILVFKSKNLLVSDNYILLFTKYNNSMCIYSNSLYNRNVVAENVFCDKKLIHFY